MKENTLKSPSKQAASKLLTTEEENNKKKGGKRLLRELAEWKQKDCCVKANT